MPQRVGVQSFEQRIAFLQVAEDSSSIRFRSVDYPRTGLCDAPRAGTCARTTPRVLRRAPLTYPIELPEQVGEQIHRVR